MFGDKIRGSNMTYRVKTIDTTNQQFLEWLRDVESNLVHGRRTI